MDNDVFRKVNENFYKEIELKSNIEKIKKYNLKFARKIELSNYNRYTGYCEKLEISLSTEKSEKVGKLIKELLEEELKSTSDFLNSVEIRTK